MLAVIESQIKSPAGLTLVSHALCPYVQRAAIALREKGVTFRRVDIDLAANRAGSAPSRRWAGCRCSALAMP